MGSAAYFSLLIDDSLPWHVDIRRKGRHGIANHASRTPIDNFGNLSVGGNLTYWNLADHMINLLIKEGLL